LNFDIRVSNRRNSLFSETIESDDLIEDTRNLLTEDKTQKNKGKHCESKLIQEKDNITKFYDKLTEFKRKINFGSEVRNQYMKSIPVSQNQRNVVDLRNSIAFGTSEQKKKSSNNCSYHIGDKQEKRTIKNAIVKKKNK